MGDVNTGALGIGGPAGGPNELGRLPLGSGLKLGMKLLLPKGLKLFGAKPISFNSRGGMPDGMTRSGTVELGRPRVKDRGMDDRGDALNVDVPGNDIEDPENDGVAAGVQGNALPPVDGKLSEKPEVLGRGM